MSYGAKIEIYEQIRKTNAYGIPRRILFGVNVVAQAGFEANLLNVGKKGLVVTDPGVLEAGLLDKVLEPLKNGGFDVETYGKVMPEPTMGSVEKAIDFAKQIEPDFVVSLGGGSSMDTAKIVAMAMTNPRNIRDYLPGMKEVFSKPGIPHITIPTTAGTGAEVTSGAVITLEDDEPPGIKAFFKSQFMFPTVAIVDPLMTLTMPQRVTAFTGLDVLSHAIEAAMSVRAFPLSEALAYEALRLISKSLIRATYNGRDLEARYNMSAAALMAGSAQTNVGTVEAHAAGHAIGTFYHIPHGVACAIPLPYVMEYNLPVNTDALVRMAVAMGEDIRGLSDRRAAYKVVYAVKGLIEEVGLPATLKDVGKKEDLPGLSELFTTNRWITAFFGNCKRSMTKENATKLFENMFEGKLGKPE